MKSLEIVFTGPELIELKSVEVTGLGPREVLCRAEKSMISTGTETLCLRGKFDKGTNWENWVKYPFHPGYSIAARVVEVGAEVAGMRVGDLVASSESHRQYFKAHEDSLYLLPHGIDAEQGTWAALSCTTQLGVRRASLELGETVGVVGMGLLGQLVIQYLRAAGARTIIAIDPVPQRLEFAKSGGATHTLAMTAGSAFEEVKAITGGRMLDVVFDITGHPSVLAPATELLRKLGRVILLGDSTTPSQQFLGPRVVADSISILGIHGVTYPKEATIFNPWSKTEMTNLFYTYLLQNRMNVSGLVTHRVSPADAPNVYEWLLKDRSEAMAIMFDWSLLPN